MHATSWGLFPYAWFYTKKGTHYNTVLQTKGYTGITRVGREVSTYQDGGLMLVRAIKEGFRPGLMSHPQGLLGLLPSGVLRWCDKLLYALCAWDALSWTHTTDARDPTRLLLKTLVSRLLVSAYVAHWMMPRDAPLICLGPVLESTSRLLREVVWSRLTASGNSMSFCTVWLAAICSGPT